MVDRKLRLAVFQAAADHNWDCKRIAKEQRVSQALIRDVSLEMEAQGLTTLGEFEEVSTKQAAWVLCVIERRVREFCRSGRLGRHCGGRYVIPVGDLLRFAGIPRHPGGAGIKQLAETRAGKGENDERASEQIET